MQCISDVQMPHLPKPGEVFVQLLLVGARADVRGVHDRFLITKPNTKFNSERRMQELIQQQECSKHN